MHHKISLKLYNTLSKSIDIFKPLDIQNVKMYVCGPTVYDFAHIGNARSFVTYDILYRALCYLYGNNQVLYVRNITDLDDKINNKAKSSKKSIYEITNNTIKNFWNDMEYMYCIKPNVEPKATDHIKEMIEIISKLLASNHAYIKNNTVYFKVDKCKFYYDLSNRNKEELLSGTRVSTDDQKDDVSDFILWKPADEDDDTSALFESPWGLGKPGWHIECSAMSYKYCGPNFDIHGGGVDLVFPHHTNEIAQSRCAFPNSKYANIWVHNGFLTVNKVKMSKSLGNFITVRDLISKGLQGEVIRYFLLSAHYRKPLDYNDKAISDAKTNLNSLYSGIKSIDEYSDQDNLQDILDSIDIADFLSIICEDLNTPKAFAYLHSILKEINSIDFQINNILRSGNKDINCNLEDKEKKSQHNIDYLKQNKLQLAFKLKKCATFLGILNKSSKDWFNGSIDDVSEETRIWIDAMITKRDIAKKEKKYDVADNIRQKLYDEGFVITDIHNGVKITKK